VCVLTGCVGVWVCGCVGVWVCLVCLCGMIGIQSCIVHTDHVLCDPGRCILKPFREMFRLVLATVSMDRVECSAEGPVM
jgi:hypothetical protein